MKIPDAKPTQLIYSRQGYALLACIGNDLFEQDQLNMLTSVKTKLPPQVELYIAHGEEVEAFAKHFSFWGTPIFLFTESGIENDRFLGRAEPEELVEFIEANLHNCERNHEG